MFQTGLFEIDRFNQFFNPDLPLLRRKESAFAIADLPGLWRIHWQFGSTIVLSTFYTRIDQACCLWGIISAVIFITAQFTPLDWQTQALLWSGLTLVGTGAMIKLAQYCATVEPINQVIFAWVVLMGAGLVITDLGVFLGWGTVLTSLCPLWLGISAVGYGITGLKMRSRAFFLISLVHLLGIAVLPSVATWQFLVTGMVLGLSGVVLGELQWDSSGVCSTHILTVTQETQ